MFPPDSSPSCHLCLLFAALVLSLEARLNLFQSSEFPTHKRPPFAFLPFLEPEPIASPKKNGLPSVFIVSIFSRQNLSFSESVPFFSKRRATFLPQETHGLRINFPFFSDEILIFSHFRFIPAPDISSTPTISKFERLTSFLSSFFLFLPELRTPPPPFLLRHHPF